MKCFVCGKKRHLIMEDIHDVRIDERVLQNRTRANFSNSPSVIYHKTSSSRGFIKLHLALCEPCFADVMTQYSLGYDVQTTLPKPGWRTLLSWYFNIPRAQSHSQKVQGAAGFLAENINRIIGRTDEDLEGLERLVQHPPNPLAAATQYQENAQFV